MTKAITWKCPNCGNEDTYPSNNNVTLESLQSEEIVSHTMCSQCGSRCNPIEVKSIDNE